MDTMRKVKMVTWKILPCCCNNERVSFEMLGKHLEEMEAHLQNGMQHVKGFNFLEVHDLQCRLLCIGKI